MLSLLVRLFHESELGDARPIPSFESSPANALEIVAVACHGLHLSPLPNRTARAFDFRRHQSEYAPTAVAIKPKTLSPIIVVGMNPHPHPIG